MALVVKDRVKETSTTSGTGALTLLGAVSNFQSFSVIGDGNTTFYAIVDSSAAAWEVGIGTYTSATTSLSRDTVLESSNAGSLVDFSANVKTVFVTYPAEKSVYYDADGNVVIAANTAGNALRITQTGAGNALVVEDEANPDSTPFIVAADGGVVSGYTSRIAMADSVTSRFQAFATGASAGFSCIRYVNGSGGPFVTLNKSRSGTMGSFSPVIASDILGSMVFGGDDGTSIVTGARIRAYVNNTVSTGVMPTYLDFEAANASGTVASRLKVGTGVVVTTAGSDPTGGMIADALNVPALYVNNVVVPTISSTSTLTNKTIDVDNNPVSNIEVDNFKSSAIVTESEGLSSSDNDTSIPTTAAVIDYVSQVHATVATTSGTSKGWSSLSSRFTQHTISFVGVSTNGTADLKLVIGDAGGLETSGYLGGTHRQTGSSGTGSNATAEFAISNGSASSVFHGSLTLTLVDPATYTWSCSGVLYRSDTTMVILVAGTKSLSAGALTDIYLETSDTFDAGLIGLRSAV